MALSDVFRNCLLLTNLTNTEEHILYNETDNKILTDIDTRAIKLELDRQEYQWFMKNRAISAKFVYNPYWEKGPLAMDGEFPIFNVYEPPPWRHEAYFNGAPILPEKRIPPLIERFLRHFTSGHDESREFVLDWLATALRARNGTYLCIISKIQGTGKGVLGEMCRSIFGERNVRKVRGDALNSRFNGQFAGAQLVMFDEFAFKDRAALDRAKDLVNAKLEVEKKGQDPIEVENQLNGYFTSNHMGAITEDGRRFSIPLTADIQLKTVFSTEEIKALQYDVPMIERFARFLWWREVERDMWLPFVSDRTKEIRDYGLAEWESLLVEEVFSKCPKGAFLKQSTLKKILQDKAPYLRMSPGRVKFAELASKFPEYLKHSRPKGGSREWGLTFLQAFPDFLSGHWCDKCEAILEHGCICPRI